MPGLSAKRVRWSIFNEIFTYFLRLLRQFNCFNSQNKTNMKALLLSFVIAVTGLAATAQSTTQVKWSYSAKKLADKTYEVHLTATIAGDWHLYSQNVGVDGPIPTSFTFTKNPLLVMDGKVNEVGKVIKKNEEVWGGVVNYYEKSVDFV